MSPVRDTVRLVGVGAAAAAVIATAAVGSHAYDHVRDERDQLRAALRSRPPAAPSPSVPATSGQGGRSTRTPTPSPAPPGRPESGGPGAPAVIVAGRQHVDEPAHRGAVRPGKPRQPASPPSQSPSETCPAGRLLTVRVPLGALPCSTVVVGGRR